MAGGEAKISFRFKKSSDSDVDDESSMRVEDEPATQAPRDAKVLTSKVRLENIKAHSIDSATDAAGKDLAAEKKKWFSDKIDKISKTIEDQKEGLIATIRKASEVKDGKPVNEKNIQIANISPGIKTDTLSHAEHRGPEEKRLVASCESSPNPSPNTLLKSQVFEFQAKSAAGCGDANVEVSPLLQPLEVCVIPEIVECAREVKERTGSFNIVDDYYLTSEDTNDDGKPLVKSKLALSELLDSTKHNDTELDKLAEQTYETDRPHSAPCQLGADSAPSEAPPSADGGGNQPPPSSPPYLSICMYGGVGVVAVLYLLLLPSSPYLAGALMGGLVVGALCYLLASLGLLTHSSNHHHTGTPLEEGHYYSIQCFHEGRNNIYKGWLNELVQPYDAENYHINQTHSVYIRLEGNSLRLSRPKQNIPRRAMYNEARHEPVFIHQRHFDISGSRVFLLPAGLAKKRIWSKKYPICIELVKGGKKIRRTLTQLNTSEGESESGVGADGFPHSSSMETLAKESCNDLLLCLFARTNHEKEIWYRHFQSASQGKLRQPEHQLNKSPKSSPKHKVDVEFEMIGESQVLPKHLHSADEIDFDTYMSRLMPNKCYRADDEENKRHDLNDKLVKEMREVPSRRWLNALLGRLFFDFIRVEQWKEVVTLKIQRKLDKIRIPHNMIEGLTVTELVFGDILPQIRHISSVHADEHGLWFNVAINYHGNFNMTINTKLNLMKLKTSSTSPTHASKGRDRITLSQLSGKYHSDPSLDHSPSYDVQQQATNTAHSPTNIADRPTQTVINKDIKKSHVLSDSDVEDTAESSSDEEEQQTALKATETPGEDNDTVGVAGPGSPSPLPGDANASSTSKKLIKLVDQIAASRYFQQATEMKYIKKAMEGISNTPLVLKVEVKSLTGTLAINIPPPPSDRIWYGFRGKPAVLIAAKPKVGMRQVNISYLTDWIESRLTLEFQRVLVLPNMDDLYIPIMSSDVTET